MTTDQSWKFILFEKSLDGDGGEVTHGDFVVAAVLYDLLAEVGALDGAEVLLALIGFLVAGVLVQHVRSPRCILIWLSMILCHNWIKSSLSSWNSSHDTHKQAKQVILVSRYRIHIGGYLLLNPEISSFCLNYRLHFVQALKSFTTWNVTSTLRTKNWFEVVKGA